MEIRIAQHENHSLVCNMEGRISHNKQKQKQQRSAFYIVSMLPWNIAYIGFFTSWQYFLYGLDVKIKEWEMEMSHMINLIMFLFSYLVKNAFSNQALRRV